jgi:hypothetical protein
MIVPNVGVAGIPVEGLIITVDDGSEVHPDANVTVKL